MEKDSIKITVKLETQGQSVERCMNTSTQSIGVKDAGPVALSMSINHIYALIRMVIEDYAADECDTPQP